MIANFTRTVLDMGGSFTNTSMNVEDNHLRRTVGASKRTVEN